MPIDVQHPTNGTVNHGGVCNTQRSAPPYLHSPTIIFT